MNSENIPNNLNQLLSQRKASGLFRSLKKEFPLIDFCSNDYLGFSRLGLLHDECDRCEITDKLFGATGSRLISGNSELVEETEKQIALFHHAQSALIFNSGYDANVGLLSCVPQKNDLILYDELVHASIHDGIRLSYAIHYKFRHNNVQNLQELIMRHKPAFNNIFVVVESVYSMDGDTAPLLEICDLFREDKKVFLVVDEAHAIGVFGRQGRGLCNALNIEKDCFARIYTYGKAMGCHGAAIVGSETLRDYLINYSRPFIYTTALPAHSVHAIQSAYKLLISTSQQETLQENIAYFFSKSSELKDFIKSQSAVHSCVTGSNDKAEEIERALEQHNIFVKAIKSPTVKEGTERVRICLHAYNTKEEIDRLIGTLKVFG
jgi:8-amino-7-oxononanoate synthase